MSALPSGNNHSVSDELEWLEFSDRVGVSAASIWAPDYQDEDEEITLQCQKVDDDEIELITASAEDVSVAIDAAWLVPSLDESQILSKEASASAEDVSVAIDAAWLVPSLDESQILPEKTSFATISVSQPAEESTAWTAVCEDDETTLQCKRVDAEDFLLLTANVEEESIPIKVPRQVRILDESQVLPGEASFATISLNQSSEESAFKPGERVLKSNVLESGRNSPVRLLDESQVLAGEASFATVMLGERTSVRHSPIAEFLEKTKLSWHQMMLCALLVVSLFAVAVAVVLNLTTSAGVSVNSVPDSDSAYHAPPPISVDSGHRTESKPSTASIEPPSTSQKPESSLATIGITAKVVGTVDSASSPLNEKTNSQGAPQSAASDTKSELPGKDANHEASPVGSRVSSLSKPIESSKNPSTVAPKAANVQKPAAVKRAPVSEKSDEHKPRSESAPLRNEPVSASTNTAVEKIETRGVPVTGGGERPRTVTRRVVP